MQLKRPPAAAIVVVEVAANKTFAPFLSSNKERRIKEERSQQHYESFELAYFMLLADGIYEDESMRKEKRYNRVLFFSYNHLNPLRPQYPPR